MFYGYMRLNMLYAKKISKLKVSMFVAAAGIFGFYGYNNLNESYENKIPEQLNKCIHEQSSMLNTSDKSNYEKSVTSLKNCNTLADEFLKGISVNNDEYEMNQSYLIKHYESEIGKNRQQ